MATHLDVKPTASGPVMPATLRGRLAALDRRWRGLSALRGAGTLALVLVGGLLLGVVVDLAWVLPGWLRWTLWGAWVVTGFGLLMAWIIRPISKTQEGLALAARADV